MEDCLMEDREKQNALAAAERAAVRILARQALGSPITAGERETLAYLVALDAGDDNPRPPKQLRDSGLGRLSVWAGAIILAAILAVGSAGCRGTGPRGPVAGTPGAITSPEAIRAGAVAVETATPLLRAEAATVRETAATLPPEAPQAPVLTGSATRIDAVADTLVPAAVGLRDTANRQAKLDADWAARLAESDQKIKAAEAKIDAIQNDGAAGLRRTLWIVSAAGVVLGLAGVGLSIWLRHPAGLAISLVSFSVAAIAWLVGKYLTWLILGGLAIVICAGIWALWRNWRQANGYLTAMREIVRGVALSEQAAPEAKKIMREKQAEVQSPDTQLLVVEALNAGAKK
jgi:hypothetical protein